MKYSQAGQGRIFVIRLEDGDIVHEELERFARDKGIQAASLTIIGGADRDSKLVVGPEKGRSETIVPMEHVLDNVHEIAGVGTIFPDATGHPSLHLHMACGREDGAVAGCARLGVKVWHVMEVILYELLDTTAHRVLDSETGFELLAPR